MAAFTVIVTRDVTVSCVLTIDADTEEAAHEAALKMIADHPGQISWELDDCVGGDPYVTGCDQCGGEFE